MRSLTLVFIFVIAIFASPETASSQTVPGAQNSCVNCHASADDENLAQPVAKLKNDIHAQRGLSCVNCHGGDATADDMARAMDSRSGFVGAPTAKQIPAFCGKCHSNADTMKRFNPAIRVDQEIEYASSVHGKRNAQGDTSAATCVSCHGSHGITAIKDPNGPVYPTHVAETCGRCHANADYMKKYGIPTDQLQKYQTSVHADALFKRHDLSAPTCNDCHGNHGAVPPGTASVGNVCGTCHARQSELFGKSRHKTAFDAMNLSECVACHSNHDVQHPTDELIGTVSPAVCITCHDKGEAGYETAEFVYRRLAQLNERIASADNILKRAARSGMEVSKASFDLNDARDSLTNARVVLHTFSPDEVEKVIVPGEAISEKAQQAGENALRELLFRRQGLAVSLIVIAVAAASIYLKIRQIERKQ